MNAYPHESNPQLHVFPIRKTEFLNLLWKEFYESHEALILSAIFFWGAPLIIEAGCILLDPFHRTSTIGVLLVQTAGWLYACLIGAHVICRDMAHPEGKFLLAQPVSLGKIIGSKFIIGLFVVIWILGISILLDFILTRTNFSDDTLKFPLLNLHSFENVKWLIFIGLTGYILSFTLALTTRQFFPTLFIVLLFLFVWCTTPLLSNQLRPLCPLLKETNPYFPKSMIGLIPFLSLITLLAVLYFSERRQQAVHIKPRQVATGIAIVLVLIFNLAAREIGFNLKVAETLDLNGHLIKFMHHHDIHFAITRKYVRAGKSGVREQYQFTRFRLNPAGKIPNPEKFILSDTFLFSNNIDSKFENLELKERTFFLDPRTFFLDSKGDLVVPSLIYNHNPDGKWKRSDRLLLTTFHWNENQQPSIASSTTLSMPGIPKGSSLEMSFYSSQYLYLYFRKTNLGSSEQIQSRKDTLAVFNRENLLQPLHIIPLKDQYEYINLLDNKIIFFTFNNQFIPFDLNKPDEMLNPDLWKYRESRWMDHLSFRKDSLSFQSNQFGLHISSKPNQLVGEYLYPALSLLFRNARYYDLIPLSPHLLLERASNYESVTIYDISDPKHPQRTGFYNTFSYRNINDLSYDPPFSQVNAAPIFITDRFLVLGLGYSITVIKRPDASF